MATITFFYDNGQSLHPAAALISFGVYLAIFFPAMTLFWLRRNKEPLRSRSAHLIFFQVSYMTICYLAYAVSSYYVWGGVDQVNDVGCQLQFWILTAFIPLCYMPYEVRCLRLYVQYTRGMIMVADNRIAMGLPHDMWGMEFHRFAVKSLKSVLTTAVGVLMIATFYVATLASLVGLYVWYGDAPANDPMWCETESYAWLLITICAIMNIIAYPAVALAVTVRAKDAFSMRDEFVALLATQSPLTWLCIGSMIGPHLQVTYGIFISASTWSCFLISVVWCLLQSYGHEHNQKAYLKAQQAAQQKSAKKFHTMRAYFPHSLAALLLGLRSPHSIVPVDTDNSNLTDTSTPTTGSIEMTSQLSIAEDTIAAPSSAQSKPKAAKKTVRHRSNAGIHLNDLLRDPIECQRLQTLAINCFSAELILFCMDLVRYRERIPSRPVIEQVALAVTIANRYIIQGSPRELNINDETRKSLLNTCDDLRHRLERNTLVDDDHDSLKDLFNKAEAEVKQLIKTNILPLWRPAELSAIAATSSPTLSPSASSAEA